MKVKVNQDKCIACGGCVSILPEVFKFNDEGLAEAIKEIPEEKIDEAKEAMKFCPGSAIEEEK